MTVGELKTQFAAQANCEFDTIRMIRRGVQLLDPVKKLSDFQFTHLDNLVHAVFIAKEYKVPSRMDPANYNEEQKMRKEEYDRQVTEYAKQRAAILQKEEEFNAQLDQKYLQISKKAQKNA